MKCITIQEPYASQIISGKKKREYRSWKTHYRGPLLIHVSKSPATNNSGKVIGAVILVDCKWNKKTARYDWYLEHPEKFNDGVNGKNPFAMKGRLGIFEVDLPPDAWPL